jgi:hypothetical protein
MRPTASISYIEWFAPDAGNANHFWTARVGSVAKMDDHVIDHGNVTSVGDNGTNFVVNFSSNFQLFAPKDSEGLLIHTKKSKS